MPAIAYLLPLSATLSFILATGVGYVMNVLAVLGSENLLDTGAGVVRVIGLIVPPLGAYMGLFG